MFKLSRRHLMSGAAGVSLAAISGTSAVAAEPARCDGRDITRPLARYLVGAGDIVAARRKVA
ncbi:MAG: hypothetical protein WA418_15190 [Bradyrhizobium sp.]